MVISLFLSVSYFLFLSLFPPWFFLLDVSVAPFCSALLLLSHIATLSKTDDPSLAWVCVCMCVRSGKVGGSNLMLLISANEHNLECRLSSYICWLDDRGEEQRVRERGGKSCCCSFYTQCTHSGIKLAVPFSFPVTQLNRRNRKLNRCSKFRFWSELVPLYVAQHLTHSLCG